MGSTEREKAVEFVAAWRDDDAEMRIPSGEWGDNLAHHIDVLLAVVAEMEGFADLIRRAERAELLNRITQQEFRSAGAVRAERDALTQQIVAVRAYAEDRAHYGRQGRTVGSARIASDLFAILDRSPVTPESHVMALPPESAGRIAADVKATFWPAPVTPESETNR